MTSNIAAATSTATEESTPTLTIPMAENETEETLIVEEHYGGVTSDRQDTADIDQDIALSDENQNYAPVNDTVITNTNTITTVSYPQTDFPFTFYKFMNAVSASHPHIVAWSKCGNYFKIDRNAKELTTLIGQHFQHNVYQSLRRQMNMYGFHLTNNNTTDKQFRQSNWWYRAGGFFCRDNPQLAKIRPRRRPERSAEPDDAAIANTVQAKKGTKPAKKVTQAVKETWTCQSTVTPTGKRRIQVYAASNPDITLTNSEWMTKRVKTNDHEPNADRVDETKKCKDVTTIVASKVPAASGDHAMTAAHDSKMVTKGTDQTETSPNASQDSPSIPQSFPRLLHQFISNCAASNPEIVQWNKDRTAFNVEIHHPDLPDLLLRYFQHGNYSSLRRQLNFYGFRRDEEGFYRNDNFQEGNYRKIVSRAARDRKPKPEKKSKRRPKEKKNKAVNDKDDLSSIFDHDLSTYDTLKNDDMSFEQMEDKFSDDISLNPSEQNELDATSILQSEASRLFNVKDKVYVRDKDGVMYIAVIRRHLYGLQFHKQVDVGLVDSLEEANEKSQCSDVVRMWHYFVHFDFWNVNFDRWVSESDVFVISGEVTALAERISHEHRSLQLEMRKTGVKGKKSFQTVNGAAFLKEWKKRLQKIHNEFGVDQSTDLPEQNSKADHCDESDHFKKEPRKTFTWTKAALSNEQKYRQQGLTSRRIPNAASGISIPFALKKIVVQQWEYINQCEMMPCIPASTTIRQALKQYLNSKNVSYLSSSVVPTAENVHIATESSHVDGDGDVKALIKSDISSGVPDGTIPTNDVSHELQDDGREQEWRDMVDGIAMLFDESLESRLLYREELPQLKTICSMVEFSMTPYSELYGCEHLLRLFIRLPEMLADNLPDDECRQIMAKVNDFIRFLHKNQTSIFTQTHRKLNELEKSEQQKLRKQEEKKRKERLAENDDDVDSNKKGP